MLDNRSIWGVVVCLLQQGKGVILCVYLHITKQQYLLFQLKHDTEEKLACVCLSIE